MKREHERQEGSRQGHGAHEHGCKTDRHESKRERGRVEQEKRRGQDARD